MGEAIISVENLGKCYQVGKEQQQGYTALRDVIAHKAKRIFKGGLTKFQSNHTEDFWALKDVNFEIKQGDAVGIIGRNGAGKSTLLKLLSRITEPTTGRITLNGRVASLLEVGTGFHPELTGRENIYLNGSILGMSRREIKSKFDEIVDFSGIEKFLDTPVKRYSSGMYVRLAFAVAAHLEPEILVVDEVLAVGDAEFQKKCLGKMDDVAKGGRTVLFVSHNMEAIEILCKTAIVLDKGNVIFDGEVSKGTKYYLQQFNSGENRIFSGENNLHGLYIKKVQLLANEIITNGDEITLDIEIESLNELPFSFSLFLFRENGLAFITSDHHMSIFDKSLNKTNFTFHIKIPRHILNPGNHHIGAIIADYNGNNIQYYNNMQMISFDVIDDLYRRNNKYNLGWNGAVSPILDIKVTS